MPSCTYIWYQDWKCSECCSGDRCNYFVTVSWNFQFKRSRAKGTISVCCLYRFFIKPQNTWITLICWCWDCKILYDLQNFKLRFAKENRKHSLWNIILKTQKEKKQETYNIINLNCFVFLFSAWKLHNQIKYLDDLTFYWYTHSPILQRVLISCFWLKYKDVTQCGLVCMCVCMSYCILL